jgi:hypothetical protein
MSWHISGQRSGEEQLGVGKERLGIDSLFLNFYINNQLLYGETYYNSIKKGGEGDAQL